ncbi:MAG TPA: hypothetical protein VNT60_01610 [Deinococcales bacterium]|nr:hypothetical protein [Deinococcales bacterium]
MLSLTSNTTWTRAGEAAWRLALFSGLITLAVQAVTLTLGLAAFLAAPRLDDLGKGFGGLGGIPALVLLAVSVLNLPLLLHGLASLPAGGRKQAPRLLLATFPLAVFVSYAFLAHLFDPCGRGLLSSGSYFLGQPLCSYWGSHLETSSRLHLLQHAVNPTLAVVGAYALAIRIATLGRTGLSLLRNVS